jgi:serine/threonine-protein kinase
MGSPLYMCPEQATSYDRLDARSDVYSLGAVAYYLVTGRPPFESGSIWEVMKAHSRDPVKLPAEVNPAVPADLERVILRCLAKLPTNRFQDMDSLEKALSECTCAGKWTEEKAAAWWEAIKTKESQ